MAKENEEKLLQIHRKYVKGTGYKAIIKPHVIYLCDLTKAIMKKGQFKSRKIYLSSRGLKHIYDRRTAEEDDFLLINLIGIIRFPDHIYTNKQFTTGTKCLTKVINDWTYLLSLEETENRNNFVTCFRIRGGKVQKYLTQFKKL